MNLVERPHPTCILRLPSVIDRTGLSRSTLYQRISSGTFPKQVSLGRHAVGWIETEVDLWIADRVAERSRAQTLGFGALRAKEAAIDARRLKLVSTPSLALAAH